MTDIESLAKRYREFGVSVGIVGNIVQSGIDNGLTRNVAFTGARLALAHEFQQQEYFTTSDVAEALGVTVEEVNATVEQNRDELARIGGITSISVAQGLERFLMQRHTLGPPTSPNHDE